MSQYRIKAIGTNIVLCDKDGNPIPKQFRCEIISEVGEALTVNISCFVDPSEVDPELLRERSFIIVEDEIIE